MLVFATNNVRQAREILYTRLVNDGLSKARLAAGMIKSQIEERDGEELEIIIPRIEMLDEKGRISELYIITEDGEYIHNRNAQLKGKPVDRHLNLINRAGARHRPKFIWLPGGNWFRTDVLVAMPVMSGDRYMGSVHIVFSAEKIRAQIFKRILIVILLMTFAVAMVVVLSQYAAKRALLPLSTL
ncbi:MAG: hypothetical protein WCX65_12295, partial [bacterium]